jgi:hypothetical protein
VFFKIDLSGRRTIFNFKADSSLCSVEPDAHFVQIYEKRALTSISARISKSVAPRGDDGFDQFNAAIRAKG